MNRQNSISKPKQKTVAAAKKTLHDVITPAQQLVIPSRHIIPVAAADAGDGSGGEDNMTAKPAKAGVRLSNEQPKPSSRPTTKNTPASSITIATTESPKTEDTAQAPVAQSKAETQHDGATSPAAPIDAPAAANDSKESTDTELPAATPAGDPTPETRKVVEEAAKANKREQELEKLIDSRQFFLPVNTEAQKRSIKVSFGLTLLVLVLGFALIDLLLDTGAILLVQRIPHTHFFTTNTSL